MASPAARVFGVTPLYVATAFAVGVAWVVTPAIVSGTPVAESAGRATEARRQAAAPDRLSFATAQDSAAVPGSPVGPDAGAPPGRPLFPAAAPRAAQQRSVVFRKDEAEALAFAQSGGTIQVFGYRDPDDRRAPPRTLENRFASTLDAGSPELVAGQSRRHDCLYIGVFGFSCADPLSSLLVNLRWHLR